MVPEQQPSLRTYRLTFSRWASRAWQHRSRVWLKTAPTPNVFQSYAHQFNNIWGTRNADWKECGARVDVTRIDTATNKRLVLEIEFNHAAIGWFNKQEVDLSEHLGRMLRAAETIEPIPTTL